MLTLQREPAKPIWISHRGIRDTGFTENTRSAYELAVERGFQWLETDLRLTKDDHIVLCHDRSLERITGEKSCVDGYARAQLTSMKLKCGQHLLFLDEFLRHFSSQSWVFDMKLESSRRCIQILRKMIDQLPKPLEAEAKITFLFWSDEDEKSARKLFPKSQFFAQKNACWRAGVAALFGLGGLSGIKPQEAYAVIPHLWGISLFQKRVFDIYHQRQGRVIAYLPETPELAHHAVQAGADFILSDSYISTR